jgi:lipoprotein-releasing system permease protein
MARPAMYKYLLCWRYLRTRYIALASVVSVVLGVATMIVVNSVMAGFADMMRTRLHGVLADIVVESYDLDGFANYHEVMARIKEVAGDKVVAMAPTMETFGLMKITLPNGNPITRYVQIMGVRPEERAQTGEFASFLQDEQQHRVAPSFEVTPELRKRAPAAEFINQEDPNDPFNKYFEQSALEEMPDRGAFIGWALGTIHRPGSKTDDFLAPRGTKISLAFAAAGKTPQPGFDEYTVVGYFKSGMSEYDSMHVYVPLERLQQVRNLGDGKGNGRVNQIQIKAKPGVDLDALSRTLQNALDPMRPLFYRVSTWEQKQGPLLAAVQVEQNILNMLLFFIIAVAGFGILAIFSMIVVEKTRDIGILKALGASTAGVRNIFLGYGLSLGLVGCGVGMGGGLLFVYNINRIEKWLSTMLGRKIFDDSIYYFNEIPTLVELSTVLWIVFGTLLITVAASIWPAQRAAKLQPVQALRFE